MKRLVKKIVFIIVITVFSLSCFFFVVETGSYTKYINYVNCVCKDVGVNKNLALAIMRTESNFNKSAVSKRGAIGLMQLMPSTAEFIAVKINFTENIDLLNPKINVYLGIHYLNYLLQKFQTEKLAIIAYNAGEGNVKLWQDLNMNSIPFRETEIYLKRVKRRKILYSLLSGD